MANRRERFYCVLPRTHSKNAERTMNRHITLGGITFHTDSTVSRKMAVVNKNNVPTKSSWGVSFFC